MNIFEVLRQADAYPKTLEDFRVKTFSGAIGNIYCYFLTDSDRFLF